MRTRVSKPETQTREPRMRLLNRHEVSPRYTRPKPKTREQLPPCAGLLLRARAEPPIPRGAPGYANVCTEAHTTREGPYSLSNDHLSGSSPQVHHPVYRASTPARACASTSAGGAPGARRPRRRGEVTGDGPCLLDGEVDRGARRPRAMAWRHMVAHPLSRPCAGCH